MVVFVLIIAVLTMAVCIKTIFLPAALQKIMRFFFAGSRIYLGGIFKICVGLSLLVLSPRANIWAYPVAFGLACLAGGIWPFFSPLKRTKKIIRKFLQQPAPVIRLYAAVMLLLWVVLLYSVLPLFASLSPR